MCRFLVYCGREVFLSDLITRSEQSLIRQSFKARERKEPLNGDGFGVGWYAHEIDPTPCVFTAVTPAWSNRNLQRLAEKIRSTCVFAHVRAASPGTGVTELNCHPFQYRHLLWMHNGRIPNFSALRRRIREQLNDEFYNYIQGTTDSEHAFALFLNGMRDQLGEYDLNSLVSTMGNTIGTLEGWNRAAGTTEPCFFNFAVTDGYNVVATRYVSEAGVEPETLYVAKGKRFESRDGSYDMVAADDQVAAVIIASEPLTDDRTDWEPVPRNHFVAVSRELDVRVMPIQ
jgi:ergothioneine biosynthesis protein EgtC